jgi:hypothetical protein
LLEADQPKRRDLEFPVLAEILHLMEFKIGL